MKQVLNIITTVLLSLMVVYMGVGVALVHCSHTGKETSMAVLEQPGKCHEPMTGKCMKVQVHKLSAQQVASSHAFNFHAFQPLLFTVILPHFSVVSPFVSGSAEYGAYVCHIPPRSYLSFIRILII